jgi:hypothetical protein
MGPATPGRCGWSRDPQNDGAIVRGTYHALGCAASSFSNGGKATEASITGPKRTAFLRPLHLALCKQRRSRIADIGSRVE